MGLDQNAYILLKNATSTETTDKEFYWRKHPNLEGWMADKYYQKGNKGEFNCKELELNLEDILRLESAVKKAAAANSLRFIAGDEVLPYPDEPELPTDTKGFFFGDNANQEYLEQDLEFIEAAKKALNNGQRVIYTSSW